MYNNLINTNHNRNYQNKRIINYILSIDFQKKYIYTYLYSYFFLEAPMSIILPDSEANNSSDIQDLLDYLPGILPVIIDNETDTEHINPHANHFAINENGINIPISHNLLEDTELYVDY